MSSSNVSCLRPVGSPYWLKWPKQAEAFRPLSSPKWSILPTGAWGAADCLGPVVNSQWKWGPFSCCFGLSKRFFINYENQTIYLYIYYICLNGFWFGIRSHYYSYELLSSPHTLICLQHPQFTEEITTTTSIHWTPSLRKNKNKTLRKKWDTCSKHRKPSQKRTHRYQHSQNHPGNTDQQLWGGCCPYWPPGPPSKLLKQWTFGTQIEHRGFPVSLRGLRHRGTGGFVGCFWSLNRGSSYGDVCF